MPAYCGRRHFWSIEMSEYPKALYKGDKKNHDFTTAFDADAENQLREDGYVDYKDLSEYEEPAETETKSDSVDIKELKQELIEALKKNEEKDEEILDLKQTYIAENNKLRQKVRQLELGNLDASELRNILDKKQIKYGSRDGKDELVKLVFDSEYPIEKE